jgi:uncharacterized phiE125 gp8 family phage protein
MEPPFRTIPPTATPVSLTEVKAHCRVGETDDDAALTALLNAATDHLDGPDGLAGKCMVAQTWCQRLSAFGDCMRLTVEPVASVTSITYFDADNVQQTLSTSVYELSRDRRGHYISLKPDQSWPTTYSRKDAVSITFVAGDAVENVPDSLKAAVLMLVSHWDDNRDGGSEIPNSVRYLVGLRREMFV